MFNIWLHLLEGVTAYLDVQSRLLTLPWVYGAARWVDIWGIVFRHAVPDRCRLQRLSGLNALICHYRPACGGLLFQAKLVWHWAAGTLLLLVSCLSSNKVWKTGEFPPLLRRILQFLWKVLAPFVCSYPLFTRYRVSGSTVSSRGAPAGPGVLTNTGLVGLWSVSWVCGAVTSNLFINTAVTGAHHAHTHTPVNGCLYVQTHTS